MEHFEEGKGQVIVKEQLAPHLMEQHTKMADVDMEVSSFHSYYGR